MHSIFLITFFLIVTSIIICIIIFTFAWSAKSTFTRGGMVWSAKSLPLKRRNETRKNSLLNQINKASNEFLEAQKESQD